MAVSAAVFCFVRVSISASGSQPSTRALRISSLRRLKIQERADATVSFAFGLAAEVVQGVHPVWKPHLFQRPLHAQVFRLSDCPRPA